MGCAGRSGVAAQENSAAAPQRGLPRAVVCVSGRRHAIHEVSSWPVRIAQDQPLADHVRHPKKLSIKAASGFRARLIKSSLRGYPGEFLDALTTHVDEMLTTQAAIGG